MEVYKKDLTTKNFIIILITVKHVFNKGKQSFPEAQNLSGLLSFSETN